MTAPLATVFLPLAIVGGALPLESAEPPPKVASYALIIGVNAAGDENRSPLRYADDDAARYFELFRSLNARTYLLFAPDTNTRRVHPQAAAEAYRPDEASLSAVVDLIGADVNKARLTGSKAVLYIVYSGHGDIQDGVGYVNLQDGKLTGERIAEQIIAAVRPDTTHVIVDACNSYFLAYPRGAGGEHREVSGFGVADRLAETESVGLLLSTSTARESHEWDAYQAGVFSHEVRSGLYGAADANGDGMVSYSEIAAFVQSANAAIINDRFAPRVHARPPRQSDVLVDIRSALEERALHIEPREHGHYFLEDARGVRLLDFHNAPTLSLSVALPVGPRRLYMRRVRDDREITLPAHRRQIRLAALRPRHPRGSVRGAAHHAFKSLFSLPFEAKTVEAVDLPQTLGRRAVSQTLHTGGEKWRALDVAALAATSAGVGAGLVGLAAFWKAHSVRNRSVAHLTQRQVAERNQQIRSWNSKATILVATGGAVAAVFGMLAGFRLNQRTQVGLLLDESQPSFAFYVAFSQ